jgi:hypothetical protein
LYFGELAKEIKNELATFYSPEQIEMIFLALSKIAKKSISYLEAVRIIENHCEGIEAERLLEDLFERSVIGNCELVNNWYSFKCRQGVGPRPPVTFDKSQNIVLQYGISGYLHEHY